VAAIGFTGANVFGSKGGGGVITAGSGTGKVEDTIGCDVSSFSRVWVWDDSPSPTKPFSSASRGTTSASMSRRPVSAACLILSSSLDKSDLARCILLRHRAEHVLASRLPSKGVPQLIHFLFAFAMFAIGFAWTIFMFLANYKYQVQLWLGQDVKCELCPAFLMSVLLSIPIVIQLFVTTQNKYSSSALGYWEITKESNLLHHYCMQYNNEPFTTIVIHRIFHFL
jgi:hypothetical protein